MSPGSSRSGRRRSGRRALLIGASVALALAAAAGLALRFRSGGEAPPPGVDGAAGGPAGEAGTAPDARERALRTEQLDAATRLAKEFPDSDDAVYLLGLVHREQGNSVEAVRRFEQALKMDPSRADACDSLGHEAWLREDLDAAEGSFRKAIAIDPGFTQARQNLAQTLLRQGKAREAIETLETIRDRSAKQWEMLAEACLEVGDLEKARKGYESAIALSPKTAEAHYGLARTLARMGQEEASRERMKTFNELRAGDQKTGRHWRKSFDPLEVTVRSVAQTHTDVGRVYAARGRMGEAEKLWARAAALDPGNVACRSSLAQLYLREGRDLPRARALAAEAARLEPRPWNFATLAQACARSGDRAGASAAIRQAIELDPGNPEYRKMLEALSRSR